MKNYSNHSIVCTNSNFLCSVLFTGHWSQKTEQTLFKWYSMTFIWLKDDLTKLNWKDYSIKQLINFNRFWMIWGFTTPNIFNERGRIEFSHFLVKFTVWINHCSLSYSCIASPVIEMSLIENLKEKNIYRILV